MNRHLLVLVSFCVAVFVASFYVAITKDSAPAYSLSVVSFVCVVALYAAGVLGYKVGGSQLSLEAKVNNLEQQNTELKEAVTALLKSLYVLEHGSSLWEGTTEKHYALVSKYLEPISHLVSDNVREQVVSDMAKFREETNP